MVHPLRRRRQSTCRSFAPSSEAPSTGRSDRGSSRSIRPTCGPRRRGGSRSSPSPCGPAARWAGPGSRSSRSTTRIGRSRAHGWPSSATRARWRPCTRWRPTRRAT